MGRFYGDRIESSFVTVADFSAVSKLWGADPENDGECEFYLDPLVEEVVCRGLVYRRLRDYVGVWPAVLVSGLMFGIYHGNVVQGIYASVLGILMALLVEITGSLWASILFHVGANFISTFFSEFGVQLSQWNGGIGAVLFMGMCFLFFWGGICYFWVRWKKTAS